VSSRDQPRTDLSLPPRLLALVFAPFAAGFFLSYLFHNVNAVIAKDLAAEFSLSQSPTCRPCTRLNSGEKNLATKEKFIRAKKIPRLARLPAARRSPHQALIPGSRSRSGRENPFPPSDIAAG
jgi:hypothetical protein